MNISNKSIGNQQKHKKGCKENIARGTTTAIEPVSRVIFPVNEFSRKDDSSYKLNNSGQLCLWIELDKKDYYWGKL